MGGGDSFASGLIYGLLEGEPLPSAVEYGACPWRAGDDHPGRRDHVTKAEVLKLAGDGGARVVR